MIIDWLVSQLLPTAPGFWLLLHLVAGAITLVYRRVTPSTWSLNLWRIHHLLIPYCGLLVGGLSPRLLGLGYIDWQISLSLGAGILFVGLALLVAARASIDLSSLGGTDKHTSPSSTPQPVAVIPSAGWWRTAGLLIFHSGIDQFHWTFLRGSIWELLLNLPIPPQIPAYWAVWLAAVVIFCELLFRRLSFVQWLVQLAILLTTGILFFYTGNFWLCWILHAATLLLFTPRQSPGLDHQNSPHPMAR